MADLEQQPRIYKVEDVAARFGVKEQTVREWLKSGKLKGFKAVRDWRITEEAIDDFMRQDNDPNGS